MNATDRQLRIAVVGHVDHGKSTLIGRTLLDTESVPESVLKEILASVHQQDRLPLEFITDHLHEERRDAMTIDTTQYAFDHAGRSCLLIDTPGHAEYIKNMLTGTTRADIAILIVDGHEGLQEQTDAHVNILKLLGLKTILPVINKMDRVDYSEERYSALKDALFGRYDSLSERFHTPVPIVALTGENVLHGSDNMPWYAGPTLVDILCSFPPPVVDAQKPLRCSVQGRHTIDGCDLLLARVESGSLAQGQSVTVSPANEEAVIKEIRTFDGQQESATAGQCVALVLERSPVLSRGDILCGPGLPLQAPSHVHMDALWLAGGVLKRGDAVDLQVSTQSVRAEVTSVDKLMPGQNSAPGAEMTYGDIGRLTLQPSAACALDEPDWDSPLSCLTLLRDGHIVGVGRTSSST